MNIEKLKEDLCKYGTPRVVKAGAVLTIFITGDGLGMVRPYMEVQQLISKAGWPTYTIVEATVNDDNYILTVLRKSEGTD